MPLNRSLRAVIAAALLCSFGISAGQTTASPAHQSAPGIPRVFLSVVPQFARSPIPVYYPTWLPHIAYKHKIYPKLCISRHKFAGPAYELGLYISPRFCDHADRLFEIWGVAGDRYSVNTHTHPVWLGKNRWAYIDPDDNNGWTISFVRAVGHTRWPPAYLPEYTYTILGACGDKAALKGMFACLKHVAASVRRYRPHSSRR